MPAVPTPDSAEQTHAADLISSQRQRRVLTKPSMSAAKAAAASPDPWDQPSRPIVDERPHVTDIGVDIGQSTQAQRRPGAAGVVDDWEDDSDPEGETEADNQKIWDDAIRHVAHLLRNECYTDRNTRAPMPQLVLSSSSTTQPPTSLPPTIFQAPIRILKRNPNSASPSPAQSGSGTPTQESLAEREARYQAARQRIFADTNIRGRARRCQCAYIGLTGGCEIEQRPRPGAVECDTQSAGAGVRDAGRGRQAECVEGVWREEEDGLGFGLGFFFSPSTTQDRLGRYFVARMWIVGVRCWYVGSDSGCAVL
ncbi:hypothetical protein EVG20_g1226 [Dentipellis fragilis]|uniref:SUZ domain-containing protein n=1 Tax=Dentipellis fragilis TaxID=205917 RepID=A0A4Y9ZC93_9AGAM|nr:hypothetical protein EVG20_g1226 [Dentipellis fragilis]